MHSPQEPYYTRTARVNTEQSFSIGSGHRAVPGAAPERRRGGARAELERRANAGPDKSPREAARAAQPGCPQIVMLPLENAVTDPSTAVFGVASSRAPTCGCAWAAKKLHAKQACRFSGHRAWRRGRKLQCLSKLCRLGEHDGFRALVREGLA